jgi:hypothetical protein
MNPRPHRVVGSSRDHVRGECHPGGGGLQIGKNLFGDLYAQYFATTFENFDSDQYIQVGSWANAAWNYIYGTPGPQIAALVEYTEENDLPALNAVAKIWRVNVFHTVTDQWGPIIYSEYNNGQTSVPYDSQEEVYNRFFQELDEAIGHVLVHARLPGGRSGPSGWTALVIPTPSFSI